MKEKNNNVNRIDIIVTVLTMLIFAMADIATASADIGPCVIGVPSPCNGVGTATYPNPPIPAGSAINVIGNYVPGSSYNGLSDDIFPDGNRLGIYAGQEVRPDLELPETGGWISLYAPTMAMGNNNPIEVTVAYWRESGTTKRGLWVWDFSKNEGNPMGRELNSSFMSNYVREFREGKLLFVTIMKYNTEWQALLYNFSKGKWDKIYSTKGISINVTNGWDSWEPKNLDGVCPDVPKIESTQLKIYDKGGFTNVNGKYVYKRPGWYLVDSKYGKITTGDLSGCKDKYLFKTISPYYHWQVSSSNVVGN